MTLLSEDVARKETCPLIRYCVNEQSVLQNNATPIYVHQTCKGADCKIGWRWGPAGEKAGVGFCGSFGAPVEAEVL